MTSSAIRRALAIPFLAAGAALITFCLVTLLPGDPAAARLGESAAPADLASLRASMGLDQPFVERLGGFAGGLVRGDLGRSWGDGRPCLALVLERLPATAELGGASLGIGTLAALVLALVAASRRGGALDRLLRVGASWCAVVPSYASGPILMIVFGVALGWLPVAGRRAPGAWVLPSVALAIPLAGSLFRFLRAGLEAELDRPWIRTARAAGVGPWRRLVLHALPNAALPAFARFGLEAGELLTGAVVAETLFSWPGAGRLLVEAIRRRDYPLLEATVLAFAFVYLGVNLIVDVVSGWLDPRAAEAAA